MGEKVFFKGPSQTNFLGNKLVHGLQGKVVMGSAIYGQLYVTVLFPGNRDSIPCLLKDVCRFHAAAAANDDDDDGANNTSILVGAQRASRRESKYSVWVPLTLSLSAHGNRTTKHPQAIYIFLNLFLRQFPV